MTKTYNINIGGRPFIIDCDAYDMLSEYLNTLGHAFQTQELGPELLDDIEARVAELLSESLELSGSAIVTVNDVKAIITRIGRPEEMMEFAADETNPGEEQVTVSVTEESPLPPPYKAPVSRKRLFRDPSDKMLGGVCSGFAAYFNIDPTWVRLGVVVLCLLSIFGVGIIPCSTILLAYFVLWMVLPEAVTPLQKLQMRGEAPTVENIGEEVASSDAPAPGKSGFLPTFLRFCAILAKICLVVFAIIAIPICIAVFIGCMIVLFAWLISAGGGQWALFGTEVNGAFMTWSFVSALSWMLLIGIPALTLIVIGFNKLRNRPAISRPWSLSLLTIWIIAFVFSAVSTGILVHRQQFREVMETIADRCEEAMSSADATTDSLDLQLDLLDQQLDGLDQQLDSIARQLDSTDATQAPKVIITTPKSPTTPNNPATPNNSATPNNPR